jgi:hypothetical protein
MWLDPMIKLAVAKHHQKQAEKAQDGSLSSHSTVPCCSKKYEPLEGVSSTWSITELFRLDPENSVQTADERFQKAWKIEMESIRPSLTRAILRSYGKDWCLTGILCFFGFNMSLMYPLTRQIFYFKGVTDVVNLLIIGCDLPSRHALKLNRNLLLKDVEIGDCKGISQWSLWSLCDNTD